MAEAILCNEMLSTNVREIVLVILAVFSSVDRKKKLRFQQCPIIGIPSNRIRRRDSADAGPIPYSVLRGVSENEVSGVANRAAIREHATGRATR